MITLQEERLRLAHRNLKTKLIEDYELSGQRARGARPSPEVPSPLQQQRFLTEVHQAGAFTQNWFTHNIAELYEGLQQSGQTFNNYLEVGSFEGLSTCWFGRFLQAQSRSPAITAMDLFPETSGNTEVNPGWESRFDRNCAKFLAGFPLRKIKSDSARALAQLRHEGAQFDLIYVDGSHGALDVVVDACLCWRLLRPDGVILFDDYYWDQEAPASSVLGAVNAFLDLVDGQYRVLKVYYQVMLQKI